MNCPSRTDAPIDSDYNQNPPHLSPELTTTADLNGIVNERSLRRRSNELNPAETSLEISLDEPPGKKQSEVSQVTHDEDQNKTETIEKIRPVIERGSENEPAKATFLRNLGAFKEKTVHRIRGRDKSDDHLRANQTTDTTAKTFDAAIHPTGDSKTFKEELLHTVIKFGKFIGPGFMVSVAYIDPGNYATDVAAGASYRFKLLFVVLLSNLFAAFLQSLCIKLGTVTGLNLAENCRAHCPKWLNISLYILAEVAIIATDIAEVIGTAIALNLLNDKIPLVAGCALSILDVLLILFFYRPNGSLKGLQAFEIFVAVLVLGVVVSFCLELSLIKHVSVGEVFRGYLPSSALVQSKGLYQACGILGATVMPHSLYLGSGIVQARLTDFDVKNGYYTRPPPPTSRKNSISGSPEEDHKDSDSKSPYRPSMAAIKYCLKFSTIELCISLFTFALFVNSAILIVSGASLSSDPTAADADIFGIHALLSSSLSPAAGIIFALALLLSGISAGVVCTIAGQMVSEGALNWTLAPWIRRLITRSISITPSIIIAGAVGREGLSAALNGTQVVLSVVLPFVSAPLIWFTCRGRYMTVSPSMPGVSPEGSGSDDPGDMWVSSPHASEASTAVDSNRNSIGNELGNGDGAVAPSPRLARIAESVELEAGTQNLGNIGGNGVEEGGVVKMRNHWFTTVVAVIIWLIITIMNVANLVLLKNQ